MTTLTETTHDGEFIVSEASGTRSREVATLITGQDLAAGAVLGMITASSKYTVLAPAAGDGSEAAAGILFAATDATSADEECVLILRDAEVNGGEIGWPAGISAGEKTTAIAELAALGIIVR
jgi:hypothetical protein